MNGRLSKLYRLRCRLRQATPAQPSGCELPVSSVPVPAAVAACIGLLLMIAGPAAVNAAAADSPEPGELQASTTQSEFERLMAVARKTRGGAGSTVDRIDIADRPALGDEDAQLVLVEIASFECPYCRRHWLDTMPALRQRYIETDRLRYVFIDVVIDPNHHHAQAATEAAHCANEQGRYTAFRDRIFRQQKAIAAEFLEVHAQAVGIDLPEFRRCVESGRYRTRVEDDTGLGRRLRVRGTPSFFWARAEPGRSDVRLVRRISGARPMEHFARQFDELSGQNPVAIQTMSKTDR